MLKNTNAVTILPVQPYSTSNQINIPIKTPIPLYSTCATGQNSIVLCGTGHLEGVYFNTHTKF